MTLKDTTYGGREWFPRFVEEIDQEKCVGCGRCYKVCGRSVLALIEKPFEGEDEYGDNMGNQVMSVAARDDCIGCGACGRVCAKKCYTYTSV